MSVTQLAMRKQPYFQNCKDFLHNTVQYFYSLEHFAQSHVSSSVFGPNGQKSSCASLYHLEKTVGPPRKAAQPFKRDKRI